MPEASKAVPSKRLFYILTTASTSYPVIIWMADVVLIIMGLKMWQDPLLWEEKIFILSK